jgi:hypothetical protein
MQRFGDVLAEPDEGEHHDRDRRPQGPDRAHHDAHE